MSADGVSPDGVSPDGVSPDASVSVARDEHIAIVEMRRPPANFFDREVLTAVADAGERAAADGARALVLCSQGKHFCAGARLADSTGSPRDTAAAVYQQAVRILRLDIPVVAAVQGAAVGGGLGLACAADFRVASPSSRFEANFARLGFHHGFALSLTLPRIIGHPRAELMLYGARRVGGQEAHALGLVDRLADAGQERAVALDIAREIAAGAPLAVRSIRRTMRAELVERVEAALAHELDEQEWLWRTEDAATGLTASMERRDPTFVGR